MSRMLVALFLIGVLCGVKAQTPPAAAGVSSVPDQLPGKGLAQHDFLYAGESHDRRIFIVRGGKIVWDYDDPAGKGEISDAVMLSNGNILFTHQIGVTEINPEKKVVWNYDAPALVRVVNTTSGATEKEFNLPTKHPVSVHGQFRHARLTANGTLLVAHMDLNKVAEYDFDGNELWSFPASTPWGVTPLANGNVLIMDRMGVREVTRRGDSVWSFGPADAPAYKFANLQQAWRLPNGNTVVNSWVNEWSTTPESRVGTLQALEVTPAKDVVWALAAWTPPANLGPATTIQFLDAPGAAEDVHFGPIH